MTFYMSAIILTELMMIAMTLHVLHYSGFTREQKTWYLLTFLAVMLCSAAEFAVHCGKYDARFAVPLTILTVLQFSVAPLLGVLFSGALGLPGQTRIAIWFFAANFLAEAVAAPFGLVFSFGADGYARGRLFLIYEAFYLVSLVYLIVSMVRVGRRFRNRDTRTIAMILVILVAGIVPMTIFQLNITYIAIAIGASLCYIYYNDLVQEDVREALINNQAALSRMQSHIITGLASLIENRDVETGEHVLRTGAFVETLTRDAILDGVYSDKLNDQFVSKMTTLAPMHDIGKIVVSDQILRKPGRLTPEEFELMKRHAAVGGDVIREVLEGVTDEDYLSFASDIATYHHERWDGTGYPKGLKGNEIPLAARIMAIADVFDALVSERCYKKPFSIEESIKIIEEGAGTQFDPELVGVFLRHRAEFCRSVKEAG
ncbi:MAG: HD-GYP domain-containing protein [Clostridia bacterium]|nr:HD-GYP domain-containing protein [Clostridia bacterium]MBR5044779.1 HD-GYP domain-containing protein [Clostridia bacterium]